MNIAHKALQFLGDFAVHASTPLLIVLDINMPRLNGKETLSAIRRLPRFRFVPVVLYTTSGSLADEDFCKKMKASWMSKAQTIEGVRQTARILAEFCALQNNKGFFIPRV